MDLFKASHTGTPLRITINLDGDIHHRIAAEIFEVDGGFVFADIGWRDNDSGHPFHFVEGDIEGSDPWSCGGTIVESITTIDREYDEWQRWAEYKSRDTRNSRENALKACKAGLDYLDSIKDPG